MGRVILFLAFLALPGTCWAGAQLTVITAEPKKIGNRTPTIVHIQVKVTGGEKIAPDSLELFHIQKSGAIEGEPLCRLRDLGDSRDGDERAADGIFSCKTTISAQVVGSIAFVIRGLEKGQEVLSRAFQLSVVDGVLKNFHEKDSAHDDITEKAKQIWRENLNEYGQSDAAQAATVRAITEIEGVRAARLTSHGDIIIDFVGGGRDQIFTFTTRH